MPLLSTLSDFRTAVSLDLRDTGNNVFTTTEVDAMVNRGISEVSEVYPPEVTDYSLSITSGVSTYALPSAVKQLYRVDIHTDANSYAGILPHGIGEGRDSGWEVHASVLWLPPNWLPQAGYKLRLFGYGLYAQLSVATATTDLDDRGIFAVREFCQMEGYKRLAFDRATFQQWQVDANNTDVSLLQVNQMFVSAMRAWRERRAALRRLRKLG